MQVQQPSTVFFPARQRCLHVGKLWLAAVLVPLPGKTPLFGAGRKAQACASISACSVKQ